MWKKWKGQNDTLYPCVRCASGQSNVPWYWKTSTHSE
jgi:hypothetical protein